MALSPARRLLLLSRAGDLTMASLTPEQCSTRLVELLDAPILRALVEPARLEVFRALLLEGPSDVGRIAERLPQHRSVVSRHLGTLEEAGLVHGTREGRRHVYEVDGGVLIAWLELLLAEAKALVAVCCPPPEGGTATRARLRRPKAEAPRAEAAAKRPARRSPR